MNEKYDELKATSSNDTIEKFKEIKKKKKLVKLMTNYNHGLNI